PATTEIYTLSLHDALPISRAEVRKQRVVLENGVHATLVRREEVQALAAHPDFAGRRLFESRDQAKHSCFARTALAEEREKLSRRDRKSTRLNSSHVARSYA